MKCTHIFGRQEHIGEADIYIYIGNTYIGEVCANVRGEAFLNEGAGDGEGERDVMISVGRKLELEFHDLRRW